MFAYMYKPCFMTVYYCYESHNYFYFSSLHLLCVVYCIFFTSLFELFYHFCFCSIPIQVLTLYDEINVCNVDRLVSWVAGLQQEDGSFYGDKWGECVCGGCIMCSVDAMQTVIEFSAFETVF